MTALETAAWGRPAACGWRCGMAGSARADLGRQILDRPDRGAHAL